MSGFAPPTQKCAQVCANVWPSEYVCVSSAAELKCLKFARCVLLAHSVTTFWHRMPKQIQLSQNMHTHCKQPKTSRSADERAGHYFQPAPFRVLNKPFLEWPLQCLCDCVSNVRAVLGLCGFCIVLVDTFNTDGLLSDV